MEAFSISCANRVGVLSRLDRDQLASPNGKSQRGLAVMGRIQDAPNCDLLHKVNRLAVKGDRAVEAGNSPAPRCFAAC